MKRNGLPICALAGGVPTPHYMGDSCFEKVAGMANGQQLSRRRSCDSEQDKGKRI